MYIIEPNFVRIMIQTAFTVRKRCWHYLCMAALIMMCLLIIWWWFWLFIARNCTQAVTSTTDMISIMRQLQWFFFVCLLWWNHNNSMIICNIKRHVITASRENKMTKWTYISIWWGRQARRSRIIRRARMICRAWCPRAIRYIGRTWHA